MAGQGRHNVLVSFSSSLHRVSRPESVFLDVQGVEAPLMLNFRDPSRSGSSQNTGARLLSSTLSIPPSSWFPERRLPAQRHIDGGVDRLCGDQRLLLQ